MSLSKYYESSNFFQPEEIVKHDGGKKAAQPVPAEEDLPFSSQSLIEGLAGQPDEAAADPPQEDNIPLVSVAPEAVQELASTVLPPSAATIDLDQYVEQAVAERQKEEAYRRGVEKGSEEERKRAEEDFAAAGRALLLACRQLDSIRETIVVNSSRELVEFALAIAEKIVRVSLREQDASIVATIEEALRRAIKSEEFTVFLHPDDYAAVAARTADIIAGISGLNHIALRKDRTIERGGAKIESDNCTIDATVASQFDLIRDEVRKKL